jgi:hypothetical protein
MPSEEQPVALLSWGSAPIRRMRIRDAVGQVRLALLRQGFGGHPALSLTRPTWNTAHHQIDQKAMSRRDRQHDAEPRFYTIKDVLDHYAKSGGSYGHSN